MAAEDGDNEEDEANDEHHQMIKGNNGNSKLSAVIGASLVKKVTGALIAQAFLPSPVEVKQCLVYTDLAMKIQIIFFDL